eukprot:3602551-Rhodomonas_salina.1
MKSAEGEYEFGQMPLKTYLCKGAPVMMTPTFVWRWACSMVLWALSRISILSQADSHPSLGESIQT